MTDISNLKRGYYWFKIGSRKEEADILYESDKWMLGIWDEIDWCVPYIGIDSLNHNLIQLAHAVMTPDGKMSDIEEDSQTTSNSRPSE